MMTLPGSVKLVKYAFSEDGENDALPYRVGLHPRHDIGRQSYYMTVDGKYDKDIDKVTRLTRMCYHTPKHHG